MGKRKTAIPDLVPLDANGTLRYSETYLRALKLNQLLLMCKVNHISCTVPKGRAGKEYLIEKLLAHEFPAMDPEQAEEMEEEKLKNAKTKEKRTLADLKEKENDNIANAIVGNSQPNSVPVDGAALAPPVEKEIATSVAVPAEVVVSPMMPALVAPGKEEVLDNFEELMNDPHWIEFKTKLKSTFKGMNEFFKMFTETTNELIECAKEVRKRSASSKPLKSCPPISDAEQSELAEAYGMTPGQVAVVVQLTKAGKMTTFISQVCQIFGLDARTGGMHAAPGVTPWNRHTLVLAKSFIARVTGGVLTLMDAQREIVSWARYSRFKASHPATPVLDLEDD